MRWPLDSFNVTQGFLPWHKGVDLAAGEGTPIKAPDSGVVIAINSGWKPGGYFGGNYVKVRGDEGYTFYMGHMSKTATRLNARVKEGQVIGYVGATGQATGPHIHFEMSKGGKMLDARKVIKKEVEMVDAYGCDMVTRFRLGRSAKKAEVNSWTKKYTLKQLDAAVLKSKEYKALVARVKKDKSVPVGNLPRSIRNVFGIK